jgi:DNA polymerase-3 subunit beta
VNTKQATTQTATFDVNLPDALYLAEVGLSGSSTDDVTPVITASVWTLDGDTITTLSTDRYRVHTASITAPGVGHGIYGIPRDALTWLTKNRAYFRRRSSVTEPLVTIDIELVAPDAASPNQSSLRLPTGTITLTIRDDVDDRAISLRTNLVRGNFPPVLRLIEQAEAAESRDGEVVLNIDFLGKTSALAVSRSDQPRIKFTKTENPNKPGPVLVTYAQGKAIIQPNLVVAR